MWNGVGVGVDVKWNEEKDKVKQNHTTIHTHPPTSNNSNNNNNKNQDDDSIITFSHSTTTSTLATTGTAATNTKQSKTSEDCWRLRDRARTVAGCLVLCLNLGVDPPDVVKPNPCARIECWVDPDQIPPAKAVRSIGARLQSQYERWHEKAKYRVILDPTSDDLRKLLQSTRRMHPHTEDRVLFHYNGHGVPRPTANGELWVYNKGYTQYIPISVYDIQAWLGTSHPGLHVLDCSGAGTIVEAFLHFLKQRKDKERQAEEKRAVERKTSSESNNLENPSSSPADMSTNPQAQPASRKNSTTSRSPSPSTSPSPSPFSALTEEFRHILLAACSANEILPVNPELPADLFTACLTTPIQMALRWHCSRSSLLQHITSAQIDNLPGMRKPNNRKTLFGELNWIFTAITDSIAWNVLSRPLFQMLFRQDLLVASLFRNYLLAQRIFHSLNVTTVSHPALPPTQLHPLWQAWDLAADSCLSQLERYEKHKTPITPSPFFEEQLTSFEVWLKFGNEKKVSPTQLPIVLQVLLSTDHRLRALLLLSRFLDKGNWAIQASLAVGIFPYVLRLLQSPDRELREVLIFIWAKVIVYDRTCALELTKPECCMYFLTHLHSALSSHSPSLVASAIPSALSRVMPTLELQATMPPGYGSPRSANVSTSTPRTTTHPPTPGNLRESHASTPKYSHTPSFTSTPFFGNDPSDAHSLTQQAAEVLSAPDLQYILSIFVLSAIADSARGVHVILSSGITSLSPIILPHIHSSDPLLRRWVCLLISKLWVVKSPLKAMSISEGIHEQVCHLLWDPVSEVRAAALVALGSLIGNKTPLPSPSSPPADGAPTSTSSQKPTFSEREFTEIDIHIGYLISTLVQDGSPLVRRELILSLSEVVYHYSSLFVQLSNISANLVKREPISRKGFLIWRSVLRCCRDPFPSVSQVASRLREWVKARSVFQNPIGRMIQSQHATSSTLNVQSAASPELTINPAIPSGNVRHFDRYKMSSMRQHLHAPTVSSGSHTSTHLNGKQIDSSTTQNGSHPTSPNAASPNKEPKTPINKPEGREEEERSLDPTWTVPKSTFYNDSFAPISDPLLLKATDVPVPPLSVVRNRNWRQKRYQQIRAHAIKAASEYTSAFATKSFVEVNLFETDWEETSTLFFHPFENWLYAADCKNTISVWKYGTDDEIDPMQSPDTVIAANTSPDLSQSRLSTFSNTNIRGSHISSIRLLNESNASETLLCVASDDGVVKIWKDAHVDGKQKLVTSFMACAAPDLWSSSSTSTSASASSGSPTLTPPSSTPTIVLSADARVNGDVSIFSAPHPLAFPSYFLPAPAANPTTSFTTRRSMRSCPTIIDWQQSTARLIASGNGIECVKVWDVRSERCIRDIFLPSSTSSSPSSDLALSFAAIPTSSEYHRSNIITCLQSDYGETVVYAGSRNGAIRVLDLRLPASSACIAQWQEHKASILSISVRNDEVPSPNIISASLNGEMYIWDTRKLPKLSSSNNSADNSFSSYNCQTINRPAFMRAEKGIVPLSCFATHSFTPICAAGNTRSSIEIFDHNNVTLDTVKYHTGFLGHRIGSLRSLAFHKHRLLLAVGCLDSYISIFAGEKI